jgi:hypothetical protein
VRSEPVAIVSAGPSLAGGPALPLRDYDAVIGVKFAAGLYPCSHWAAIDAPVIRETRPLAAPEVLFTRRDQWARACRLEPDLAARYGAAVRFVEDVEFPRFIARKWRLYTSGAAVVLAWSLGAREVDVFGHDMAGTGDCRGVEGDGDVLRKGGRTDARWAQERAIWALLTDRLAEDGIPLRRVAA